MPDLLTEQQPEQLGEGTFLFRGYALAVADGLVAGIRAVAAVAPFRQMKTPGGRRMSVAMTGCGPLSWVTDSRGYRYSGLDPETGQPWPVMPPGFSDLARDVAARAGYAGFAPDVCLINRYVPGARMGLHQDRDERDFHWPV
ncbi:MAG: alpha-ketoglutarate-dependent dioxygenase AlkB, partial [Marinobacter sp.]